MLLAVGGGNRLSVLHNGMDNCTSSVRNPIGENHQNRTKSQVRTILATSNSQEDMHLCNVPNPSNLPRSSALGLEVWHAGCCVYLKWIAHRFFATKCFKGGRSVWSKKPVGRRSPFCSVSTCMTPAGTWASVQWLIQSERWISMFRNRNTSITNSTYS